MLHLSSQDFQKIFGEESVRLAKKSKYGNVRTVVGSLKFDSQKEARRYEALREDEKHGLISQLKLQEKFIFPVLTEKGNNYSYIADFTYFDERRKRRVVEDVKGKKTEIYKIKKGMMKFFHNIEINEV